MGKEAKWINIFRTGTHTDSAGRTRTWSEADLEAIASNYSQRTEDAPVVFGHPKNTDPAQGWITAVRSQNGILQAQFARISDKAARGVENGDYKYGSLSLTPDLKIRHFGLLGAVPPAVKGLGRVEFGDEGGLTVDIQFSAPEVPADTPEPPEQEKNEMTKELEARIKELEAQAQAESEARKKAEADLKAKQSEFSEAETKRRKIELTARVDQLVADGKLLPASKDKVLAFCEAMTGAGEGPAVEISFSEAEGKRPLVDHFLGFLAEAPTNGLTHEFSAPASGSEDAATFDGNALARKF
jgi:hypothetical protein